MDTSDIGQYGTLRLVKRQDALSVVASYPIDEESLTFGRDPTCSVRLYYPGVSAVHAKIFFEERKAFLVVMGTNGLLVDGCQVFPAPPGSTSKPTTIPLSNNSEIEIHKKRFVFTYPPKDLRKPMPLISTPSKPSGLDTPGKTAGRTRTLRLSMIQSAQVFTPGPSTDPAVNLRILQSPLKPRARSRSPEKMTLTERLKAARDDMDQDADEEIVLVDGNYPRVVEEDKDLIILEDVEFEEREPEAQSLMSSFPSPPSPVKSRPDLKLMPAPLPPVTPRRTPSRPSLHKAVLIRSAQRAVMRVEASEAHGGLAHVYEDEDDEEEDDEEEEEERDENDMDVDMQIEDEDDSEAAEVAAAISGSSFSSGSGADDNEEDDDELQHDEHDDETEDGEEEGTVVAKSSSLWRKSFEKLTWPFRAASHEAEEQQDVDNDALDVPADVNASDEDETESHQVQEDETPTPVQAPATPHQARRPLGNFMTPQPFAARGSNGIGGGRYSMAGGTGPRRVKMEPTWKVRDIVVPLRGDDEKEGANEEGGAIVTTPRRARLSDEERKAIQDRRRSALTAPDTFFGGQAPGLGRLSTSPVKNASPYKPQVQHQIQGDEEEDTRALLERMKETVEGMKRRRSLAPANAHSAGIFGLGDTPIDIDETGTEDGREPKAKAEAETESENEEIGARDANSEDEVSEGEGSDKENASDHQISDTEEHDQPPQADSIRPPRTPHLDLKQVAHGLNLPKTPSFMGVRELFKDKVDLPQTPHMDGMRHLFRQREVLATPAFEGVGEMMSTPPGWKEQGTENQEEEIEESEEEVKPKMRVRSKPASSTSVAKPASKEAAAPTTRRKTPRAAAVKTPVTEGKSNFADDEATPGDNLARVQEEDEDDNAGGKPIVKRGKGRATSADSDAEESAPAKPKARLVRGSKKVVPDIAEEPVEQPKTSRSRTTRGVDVEKVEVAPVRKTRTPAARAGSHAPDSEGSSNPGKRTTKPSIKLESSTGEPSRIAAPPKPIRKPVSRTLKSATTVSESEPEPAKKTPAARKGRTTTKTTDDESQPAVAASSKKVTRGKAAAVVDDPEDDPLDSINTPDDPVPAAPAKRAARSRTATAEAITQETQPAKATSTRKAPVKKVATKAAPAKKVGVASTIASGDSEEDVNKENAPSKEDEEAAKLKKPTRTKKIIKDEADLEVESPKPRTTRATRSKQ